LNQDDLNAGVTAVADLLRQGSVVVLTGAGISQSAGIPTYRNERGEWLGSDPMTHQAFLRDPLARQRYWARSARGYPLMGRAMPTDSHRLLARLQQKGLISVCVTQNVDALHERSGHQGVLHLHGAIEDVICLDCGTKSSRRDLQQQLEDLNPDLKTHQQEDFGVRPDGDLDLDQARVRGFKVPTCARCNGTLKPDVVFFGGNLSQAVKEAANAAIEKSSALLVIGSSLQVFSGFRLSRRAVELGRPLVLINPGASRADAIATHRIAERSDLALTHLVHRLEHSA